ncbi:hypothetical protein FRY98_24715 [Paenibacillus faecis]|uniref:Uncharacterized protein n=1 Tax=Paenibacillus faecis TaxID=862114 RepID=A0A5D0CMR2_9BACL|nr:hypothetical protein [Paenibacillus faecis]TYA10972.1 hypothetical protein FRY98_24715 [Paenibacillus faecis]
MGDLNKGLYNKYQIINRETGREVEGDYFVLKPATDPAARAALEAYAEATNNENLKVDLFAWLETMPEFSECDWCGEPAVELSYPHMFDLAIGKRMCRGCWDHDREAYKGAYGEDIGPFHPIGGDKA